MEPHPPSSQLQHSQSYHSQHQSHSPAQTPSHSFKDHNPYSDFPDSYENANNVNTTDASTAANTAANAGSGSVYHNDAPLVSPQPQNPPGRFTEEWDATQRGSSIIDGQHGSNSMQRSTSVHSYNAGDDQQLPTRGNTLKKKNSMRRNGSLKRSSSRRSMRAGSVKSLALQSSNDPDEAHSAFHSPVPTSGNPTEILSNRFQSWRKILKDLIAYFREIQTHYEHKSKSLLKLANVSNNIATPPGFLRDGGIDDALQILRTYNKNAILEANKAREIEEDVILALTGLRSDLQQKIKEIKNLSGDFKNTVDKEMDHTRKAVKHLGDVLGKNELDESSTTGKSDPYLLRMAVDRQVERQLDEENYLHQAYLNLEISGRELESIVVGEIQKAYNAYAGILKREADHSYNAIDELRGGPITMSKDKEWMHFVTHDDQFVDPNIPLRTADQIHYPGQNHEAAQEIRAGLLERKSKYLKSYTAGWYVLSATHLHEFKSADKAQAPVMSLYLPEQKVGSHSTEGGSSNKFILKGRQTGSMHRGHTWVFRAESHDTMMAWYEDIKALTEKTPEERSQFVRSHSRSLSRSSRRSVSSDGLLDDEEDEEPFSADTSQVYNPGSKQPETASRRSAGGRFPSDIQVNAQRGLQAPHSPSSVSSGAQEHRTEPDPVAVSGALPPVLAIDTHDYAGDQDKPLGYGGTNQTPMEEMPSSAAIANQKAHYDGVNPYTSEPVQRTESYPQDRSEPGHADHDHQYNQTPVQQTEPGHYDNQKTPQQTASQTQYHDDRTYFTPVVLASQAPRESNREQEPVTQQEEYQTHQNQGLSGAAFEDEENRGRSLNTDQETPRNYQRYDEFGAIHHPTDDQEPTFREANGGAGVNNFNTMAVNAEGFPKLNEVASADSDRHRDLEAPFPTIGAPVHEEKIPISDENVPVSGEKAPVRPTSNNNRSVSVQTISNLHIPGQYPKGTQV